MRSRPKIELHLSPDPLHPGARITATLTLVSKSETPCNGISMTFSGAEWRYHRTDEKGDRSRKVYHRREIVEREARFRGRTLSVGAHTRKAVFELPEDAPPSYASELGGIEYEVEARVDIPWWPDAVRSWSVPVVLPPSAIPAQKRAVRRTSERTPKGDRVLVEASVATPEVAVRGRLEGVVSLSNLGAGRVSRVEIDLVGVERALVESTEGPADVECTTWTVFDGQPGENESIPFSIVPPRDHQPDLDGELLALTHELRVTAVASRGKSVTLSLPVKLHPEGSLAPEGARLAAVGDVRVEKIWASALAKLGRPDVRLVSIDPQTSAVVLAAAGRSVCFSIDVRGAEGSFLTASCTWPSLGLGVSLRSRSWSDFVGTSVHDDVDGRLVVRAREELQIKALLDAPFRDKVLSYTDVRIEDTAGHIASPGTVQRSAPLAEFIRLALDFDAWMSTCFERVQPPLAIDASLASYRALAAKRQGHLHPGDMSIDLTFAGEIPGAVRHRFEGVVPVETVVEVPRPPRLLRSEEALRELVRATGARVVLTQRKPISLQLWQPLVEDASALEPVLAGVEATLEKFSKKKKAGPYR